ncbi:unnamed protein product [Brachionus calyciflorus]|uniref:Uncharacterized protein n=1 Tax=Brachionus calyciflorus TaxID=104777 RepID=A0A813M5Z8_9BILA|nr:unnamed protein product [Brachionus calyciflorus]
MLNKSQTKTGQILESNLIKEFTVGRYETPIEFVQEALEIVDDKNGLDRKDVKKVLQNDGKKRRDVPPYFIFSYLY